MMTDALTMILSGMWGSLAILAVFCGYVVRRTDRYRKLLGTFVSAPDVETLVKEIEETESSSMKAQIFMKLMENGYVLIHKQVNKGSKYNDQKQTIRFERALSDEVIAVLNCIKGEEIC